MNEKIIKAIEARGEMFKIMSDMQNDEFNAEDITEQFNIIAEATCEDIIRQRQRLGGDWAVSTILKCKF